MIDRHARDVAAEALQGLVNGSISNREYERRFPKSKDDPALSAIYSNVWFCYSDTLEHTLTGKYVLSDHNRAVLNRCLLFLRSNLEFEWPPTKFSLLYGILRLVGLGRIVKRWEQEDMSVGDVAVWPFLRKSHYEAMADR